MWFEGGNVSALRFSKEQRNGIEKYGWEEYNLNDYGSYRIRDETNRVNLVFTFVRQDNDIVFRVEGVPLDDSNVPSNITILHYLHNPYLNLSFSAKSPLKKNSELVRLLVSIHHRMPSLQYSMQLTIL